MFPKKASDPYIQDNGQRSTLGAMMGGGGGSDLPEYDSSDAGKVLSVDSDGELEWGSELPTHAVSDAGKVLSVNNSGGLEWKSSGGGGTTSITNIPLNSFPYTATEKGFVHVFFMGYNSTSANYYENVALNDIPLLMPNTYSVEFNKHVCSVLVPVNTGDVVSLPGNHQYADNTFNAKFIKN